jgi:hypothetical protein
MKISLGAQRSGRPCIATLAPLLPSPATPQSPAEPRVRWPKARNRCSPRGARAPCPGAHTDYQAGPRLEAHRRTPCAAAAESSVIRPSSMVTLRAGNACCKSMFQVFQMFHLDVASVSCEMLRK